MRLLAPASRLGQRAGKTTGGTLKRSLATLAASALTCGAAVLSMGTARAADPACVEDDIVAQDVVIAMVCAGGPGDFSGHAYVDGKDSNPGPLRGYVGLNNDNEDPEEQGVVGCADGDYADDEDNDGEADPNVVVGLPPGGGDIDPDDPCAPSVP